MPIALRYAISLFVIIIDQVSKVYFDSSLEINERIPVMPMFNFTLHYNEGAAFSFLNDAGGWQRWLFTAISSIVSIILIVWLYRLTIKERWLSLALALILGGAIGNLIDRVIYGHVVDFIQWYYQSWYFPTFNVADAAIFVGGAILIVTTIFTPDPESQSIHDASNSKGQKE